MKFIFFIFLLQIISVYSATGSYNACNEEFLMEISTLNAVPWPPHSGLSTVYYFKTNLNKNVTELHMNMQLQMRVGINQWEDIINENIDLCRGYIHCPINKGNHEIAFHHTIPSNSPVGNKWRGYVYFTNEKGVQIGCIELETFKVK